MNFTMSSVEVPLRKTCETQMTVVKSKILAEAPVKRAIQNLIKNGVVGNLGLQGNLALPVAKDLVGFCEYLKIMLRSHFGQSYCFL